jgi:RNA polymerase sigma factor (sigma-70 family)
MNYFIADLDGPNIDYPDPNSPEVQARLKTLPEYLKIAEKTIRSFGPKFISKKEVQEMLSSEDAISEVARLMMMGDWRYSKEKGRTEYSYRNYCARLANYDYKDKFRTKANQRRPSLNDIIDSKDDSENSLLSIIEDKSILQPEEVSEQIDRKDRIKRYLDFLLKNTILTPIQRRCLELRYFEGIESYEKIGQMMEPKVSRQAVSEHISKSLFKLKQSALGTGDNK